MPPEQFEGVEQQAFGAEDDPDSTPPVITRFRPCRGGEDG